MKVAHLVGGSTFRRTPISRSPLDKTPMPGYLSELQPVNAVNTKGQVFRASFGKNPKFQRKLDKRPLSPGAWGGEKAGKDEEMIPVNSEGPEEKHPVSFLLSNPWCPLFPVSRVSSFRAKLYVPCNTWLRFESWFILRLSCRPCFIIIIPYTCLDLLPCEVGWPAVLGADGFPRVRVAC